MKPLTLLSAILFAFVLTVPITLVGCTTAQQSADSASEAARDAQDFNVTICGFDSRDAAGVESDVAEDVKLDQETGELYTIDNGVRSNIDARNLPRQVFINSPVTIQQDIWVSGETAGGQTAQGGQGTTGNQDTTGATTDAALELDIAP